MLLILLIFRLYSASQKGMSIANHVRYLRAGWDNSTTKCTKTCFSCNISNSKVKVHELNAYFIESFE